LEVFQHMKKVFTILLALSAFGIVMSGCSKGEEAKTDAPATTDAPKAEEGK